MDKSSEPNQTNNMVVVEDGYVMGVTAKPSCRRCYGRGYEGTNDKGDVVACSCIKLRRLCKVAEVADPEPDPSKDSQVGDC